MGGYFCRRTKNYLFEFPKMGPKKLPHAARAATRKSQDFSTHPPGSFGLGTQRACAGSGVRCLTMSAAILGAHQAVAPAGCGCLAMTQAVGCLSTTIGAVADIVALWASTNEQGCAVVDQWFAAVCARPIPALSDAVASCGHAPVFSAASWRAELGVGARTL
jgi:hypothetical protein